MFAKFLKPLPTLAKLVFKKSRCSVLQADKSQSSTELPISGVRSKFPKFLLNVSSRALFSNLAPQRAASSAPSHSGAVQEDRAVLLIHVTFFRPSRARREQLPQKLVAKLAAVPCKLHRSELLRFLFSLLTLLQP